MSLAQTDSDETWNQECEQVPNNCQCCLRIWQSWVRSDRLWTELTNILNAVGGGGSKTTDKRGPRLRSPATPQSAVSPDRPRLSDPLRDSGKRVAKKLRAHST
ncbi:hypothetical protein SFRURICE_010478 [Spodoptera frugiperda]|nr:hypothetical protein SFRURICE_010478 [Spodoptera frugiperda]